MKFLDTCINGVWLIQPSIYVDDRGYFFESFSDKEFKENIGDITFVQDNQSKS